MLRKRKEGGEVEGWDKEEWCSDQDLAASSVAANLRSIRYCEYAFKINLGRIIENGGHKACHNFSTLVKLISLL